MCAWASEDGQPHMKSTEVLMETLLRPVWAHVHASTRALACARAVTHLDLADHQGRAPAAR